MNQDWSIQHRADRCAVSGEPFRDGDAFYTLLYHEKGAFRREDLSEAAFKARNENIQPYSFWRSKFETPPPPAPEALGKQTAEDLLRRYMAEQSPEHSNTRYILAIMLERKKLLKEVEALRGEDGSLTRIYEHAKTGEVFVIPDPQLRLEQIADVQVQVAGLLG
jgi:hypothetical protein